MKNELKKNGIKIIDNQKHKGKDKLTLKEAQARAELRSGIEGWLYKFYFCDICNSYHVGHAFPRERTIKTTRR